ncbi:hypothetical protein VNO78_39890 [Psophocarpus tetragonolobus]|uniref:Uncharacterized protein n=1 Tax=Psophocarpus tetragonolobus TaxID=3891 RepID=A0AAN9R7K6_PSOTE
MCKCRSHGTFPLFGLQSSHLNICYYHQDLHRRPLRPGSRPGFCSDRRALLLIGAWPLPRRPVGHRNPASGSSRIASSAYQKWPTWSSRFHGTAQQSSRTNSPAGSSYPEGNFGGNQLLDGSISLSPLYPSQTNDLHVSIAAGLHQSSPLASPRSGIVHHLSGPDRYALTRTLHRRSGSVGGAPTGGSTNQLPCALRVYSPVDSHTCQTLGPCFKTGRMGSPQADARSMHVPRHARGRMLPSTIATMTSPRAYQQPGLGPPSQSASVRAPSRSADRLSPFHIRPGHIADPHPLPSRQFQALFDSLFKVLFIFPSRYLFAIGLSPVFSLGRNLPPDWGCIPKQPDSPTAPRGATGSGHNGALTLSGAPFQGTWARSATEDASPDYNSNARGDRFSWWALPGSLAVTKGILVSRLCPQPNGFGRNLRSKTRWFTGFCNSHQVSHFATFFIDARAEISVAESHFVIMCRDNTRRHRLRSPRIALYSFNFLGTQSAGVCSPTETLLRLLLPLNDKVQWTSHNVAGQRTAHVAAIRTLHRTIQSVGATGGVYKGQGRSQRELMTRALLGIPR